LKKQAAPAHTQFSLAIEASHAVWVARNYPGPHCLPQREGVRARAVSSIIFLPCCSAFPRF
jgi:hypothetical protein